MLLSICRFMIFMGKEILVSKTDIIKEIFEFKSISVLSKF